MLLSKIAAKIALQSAELRQSERENVKFIQNGIVDHCYPGWLPTIHR